MLAAGYPKALIPFYVLNNITCLCVSSLSLHIEILLYQHGKSALDTGRTLFLLGSTLFHLIYVYVLSLPPPPRRDFLFVCLFTYHHYIYVSMCVRLCAYMHISLFLTKCACTTIIDTSHREYLV